MSGIRWFGLLVGSPLLLFGGYVLYEKVYLSVMTGHSHERVGLVVKSDEAWSFWLGVSVYGVCASMVALGGAALIFMAIKPNREDTTH